jgi:hypothetical protein
MFAAILDKGSVACDADICLDGRQCAAIELIVSVAATLCKIAFTFVCNKDLPGKPQFTKRNAAFAALVERSLPAPFAEDDAAVPGSGLPDGASFVPTFLSPSQPVSVPPVMV